jgi:5-methyltetrahydrofolate--homocysteine methyltransferase
MFTIIGERINSSRKEVYEAVKNQDKNYIQNDVRKQQEAGATYIDVNAGARIGHEMEDMMWLLEVIQDAVELPLCLDSPDPKILEAAMGIVDKTPIVNSISLEKERFDPMLSFLQGADCDVVALCMDDSGMPISAGQVFDRAGRLIESLEQIGIKQGHIYVDPLIQPLSTDITKGIMAMESVDKVSKHYPDVHFTCGLSNISYGLPQRKILNRTFLALLMAVGLDGAILDPLDEKIMAIVSTTETLLGRDEYCLNYINKVRAGEITA